MSTLTPELSKEQTEIKSKEPILQVTNLKKFFPVKKSFLNLSKEKVYVQAVNDISFNLYKGETYGLVGESGCGKSTTGRTVLKLTDPTEGEAIYDGKDIFSLSESELRKVRKDIQMVFQDPYSSLNPRKRIGATLEEPLVIHKIGTAQERTEIVMNILDTVGLQVEHYYRYPHEFSGGQRQRIGLARALIVNPKILIMDEPVSALDVSIQSQVLNLLKKLQKELSLSYLFISHDMSVIRHISDRIGVMYLGRMAEEAPTDALFAEPLHPYTQALLSAVPVPKLEAKKDRVILKGELPSPINPPSGCVFHTRCPFAEERCKVEIPELKEIKPEHFVACHLYDK